MAAQHLIETLALELLTAEDRLGCADRVVLLNATPLLIAALHLWLRLRGHSLAAEISVYMLAGVGVKARISGAHVRLIEYNPARRRALTRDFAALAALSAKCRVFATSALRRMELEHIGVKDVSLYTIATTSLSLGAKSARPGNQILLYVGDAKFEKGFCQLPTLVEALRSFFPHLRFIAHANDQQAQFPSTVSRLRELAAGGDHFIFMEGWLSDAEYNALLMDAAVVVLLHECDYYFDMETGVGLECLQLGIPFLCRKGTLMADELAMMQKDELCYGSNSEIPLLVARLLASNAYFRADLSEISPQRLRD